MKKIIAITAMAAMVAAAAMADEPTADEMSIAVSGSEELTWGVDLDEGDTGFKNKAEAKVEVTFAKAGTKSTEGEGVWAELGVKVDGDLKYKSEKDATGAFDGGKVKVDTAKIHINDLYIGLASGDITVGEFKAPNAVTAEALKVENVGGKESQGLVAGYGTDDFGIAVDFRSLPDETIGLAAGTKIYLIMDTNTDPATIGWFIADEEGTVTGKVTKGKAEAGFEIVQTVVTGEKEGSADYYTNHYGLAAEVELKDSNSFVPGLFAKAGVSYAFGSEHQFNETKQLGLGVSAGYKLSIGDTYYVKPAVGISGSKVGDGDFGMELAGGVVFGWGDTADANAGVYYLDNDETKKVTPGVGVAFKMPLTGDGGKDISIVPSFYSGDLVEGLKAAVVGEVVLHTGYATDVDPDFGVVAGVSYELPVGDSIKVTPKAGFRFANNDAAAGLLDVFRKANSDNGAKNDVAPADKTDDAANKGLLNFKAGVDISGLINNTTFGAYYQSRNLKALKDNGKAGTFNVFVKVSL
jgi:hypothetical protein